MADQSKTTGQGNAAAERSALHSGRSGGEEDWPVVRVEGGGYKLRVVVAMEAEIARLRAENEQLRKAAAPPIRRIPVYPGGPELHIPPDWTEAQIEAALALLRAQMGKFAADQSAGPAQG